VLVFLPGGSGGGTDAFAITRAGKTVKRGTLKARLGRVTRRRLGTLRPGRYSVVITAGSGRAATVVIRRSFTVK
jgi:hypothetical protein